MRPDFKTVADFRKDNRNAFKAVFRQFALLCRKLDLFGCKLVAIDGTRLKSKRGCRPLRSLTVISSAEGVRGVHVRLSCARLNHPAVIGAKLMIAVVLYLDLLIPLPGTDIQSP